MSKKKKTIANETDGTYLLKITLYIIAGSIWVRFADPIMLGDFIFTGAPLGLMIGLLFASHDHFQVDRKIEYVVLIMATVVSFFLPTGIVV